MLLKGNCQNCENPLEFEEYLLGDSATCPHCNLSTLLATTTSETPKEFVQVGLSSGKEIKITAVMLYSGEQIQAVKAKRQRIQELAGGVTVGFSPWGSVGWVLEATAAIGVIESLLSAGPQAAAKELIRELPSDYAAIENSGTYFNLATVAGREHPNPAAWSSQKRARSFIHDGSPFLKYKDEAGTKSMLRTEAIIHYQSAA